MPFPIPKPTLIVTAWNVPQKDMTKWKARGVNTLMGVGLEVKDTVQARADWGKAAADQGLWIIADLLDKTADNQLYILGEDEPDRKGPDSNGIAPATLLRARDNYRAKFPDMPVWMSLTGNKLTDPKRDDYYKAIDAASDGVSEDWYVHSKNAKRYPISHKGKALDVLRRTQRPGKPIMSIIETCWQHLDNSPDGRAPTVDETRTMIRHALSRGAHLGFFSHFFRPASTGGVAWAGFDGTLPEISAVITEEVALAKLAYDGALINGGTPNVPPPPPSQAPKPIGLMVRFDDGTTLPVVTA